MDLSPSGVSNFEDGTREPKASQLAILARLYHHRVEFFHQDSPLWATAGLNTAWHNPEGMGRTRLNPRPMHLLTLGIAMCDTLSMA